MSQKAKQRYKKTGITITQASGETKVSKTTCGTEFGSGDSGRQR